LPFDPICVLLKDEIMKRTLIASVAFVSLLGATNASAADLPVKAPAVAAVIFSWTGPYIGTNLGYSWGRGSTDGTETGTRTVVGNLVPTTVTPLAFPLSGRADVNGFIGGGQLGYNWQSGMWVFGLEGDIQLSNERGSGDVCTVAGCPVGSTVFTRDYQLDWFGTARGRVGFLPAERMMLYATGGLAYGHFTGSSLMGAAGTNALDLGSWSRTQAGWTVGAGVEAALGGNWSVKFEYLYMDLGHVGGSTFTTTTVAPVGTTTALTNVFNTRFTDNIFRVGVNYRFGGPEAIVAKY
jgi:outer membrane immunogenic protein